MVRGRYSRRRDPPGERGGNRVSAAVYVVRMIFAYYFEGLRDKSGKKTLRENLHFGMIRKMNLSLEYKSKHGGGGGIRDTTDV